MTRKDKETMKSVYIMHPFKDDPEGNIEKVKEICKRIKHEVVPLAPHLMLPNYIDEDTERGLAMQHCFKLLEGCDEAWICCSPDRISEGMMLEIKHALEYGIRVINRGEMIVEKNTD